MLSHETTLRVARVAARIKLAAAAQHIAVTPTLLSAAERMEGPISSRQIERLAELYGCEPNALHGQQPLMISARPPSLRG